VLADFLGVLPGFGGTWSSFVGSFHNCHCYFIKRIKCISMWSVGCQDRVTDSSCTEQYTCPAGSRNVCFCRDVTFGYPEVRRDWDSFNALLETWRASFQRVVRACIVWLKRSYGGEAMSFRMSSVVCPWMKSDLIVLRGKCFTLSPFFLYK